MVMSQTLLAVQMDVDVSDPAAAAIHTDGNVLDSSATVKSVDVCILCFSENSRDCRPEKEWTQCTKYEHWCHEKCPDNGPDLHIN